MKKLIFFVLFIYLIINSGLSGQKNDLSLLNLKENIEMLKEIYYQADVNGEQVKKGKLEMYYINRFNTNGNKTEDIRYFSDGRIDKKYIYIRDSLGRRIEQHQYSFDEKLIRKILYIYDETGNLTEDQSYTPEGKFEKKFVYIYDSGGNITEDISYGTDDKLMKKFTYQYDENGNKVVNYRYDNNGKLEKQIRYVYDSFGNITAEIITSSDNTIINNRYIYEYDKHGNWIIKISYFSNLPFQIVEREIKYF